MMTRTSAIEFNVAEVRRSLASADRMVRSGNRVVLDQDGLFIDNNSTGERMQVRVKDETFVFDVEFTNGDSEVIPLDSGAGVRVWPRTGARTSELREADQNSVGLLRGASSYVGFCPAWVRELLTPMTTEP